ncbi:hypothetical protein BDR05DRAFT_83843 [Suillus weaverae]|nr:hypothetical protein BDR05DRAFT_83843 [Suillus weaverae]
MNSQLILLTSLLQVCIMQRWNALFFLSLAASSFRLLPSISPHNVPIPFKSGVPTLNEATLGGSSRLSRNPQVASVLALHIAVQCGYHVHDMVSSFK